MGKPSRQTKWAHSHARASCMEYRFQFSSDDWIKSEEGASILMIPQKLHGLSGGLFRVRIGMRMGDGTISLHTFGVYQTKVYFSRDTKNIIFRYPHQTGYSGELIILSWM